MIIGINYNGMHDSSVCELDERGHVVLAVSEERFTRVKQDGRFPTNALREVDLTKVELIGVPYLASPPSTYRSDPVYVQVAMAGAATAIDAFPRRWHQRLEGLGREIRYYDHHQMHAYAAFALSQETEAICLTADYGAFNCGTTSGVFEVSRGNIAQSAGSAHGELEAFAALYSDVTALLGFSPCRHEGKVTGLAAFGKSSQACRSALWELHREIRASPTRLYDWVGTFGDEFAPSLVANRFLASEYRRRLGFTDADVARAAQDILEGQLLHVADWVRDEFGTARPLLLSGGVFANVKLNYEIARRGFKSIFVCPAMGDDGLAIGAARAAFDETQAGFTPGVGSHHATMLLGPSVSSADEILNGLGVAFKQYDASALATYIAVELAASHTVAVVRGRQEFGPRALGARSVLANPSDASVVSKLNASLGRDEFMPFGPLVRDVRFEVMFDGASVSSTITGCLAHMTICVPVRAGVQEALPAVVHVDGTARPQVLVESADPLLYEMLVEFERLTGLAMVINTSFNIHDEPIVSSVPDALAAFLEADLDVLVIDNLVVEMANNDRLRSVARIQRRASPEDTKRRYAAVNLSFGRQIVEGPGRFDFSAD